MRSPEEQQKDVQEAQDSLRAMVVAAGILTEVEAAQYIEVRLGDAADAPVHDNEHCSCGHDMSEGTFLQVGINQRVGSERFQRILTLVNSSSGSN